MSNNNQTKVVRHPFGIYPAVGACPVPEVEPKTESFRERLVREFRCEVESVTLTSARCDVLPLEVSGK